MLAFGEYHLFLIKKGILKEEF